MHGHLNKPCFLALWCEVVESGFAQSKSHSNKRTILSFSTWNRSILESLNCHKLTWLAWALDAIEHAFGCHCRRWWGHDSGAILSACLDYKTLPLSVSTHTGQSHCLVMLDWLLAVRGGASRQWNGPPIVA